MRQGYRESKASDPWVQKEHDGMEICDSDGRPMQAAQMRKDGCVAAELKRNHAGYIRVPSND